MKGLVGGIVTAIVIALVVIGVVTCTEKIPAGYVGVVYNMNGGIEKDVLKQGFKTVAPTKTITLYSVALEQSYMTADNTGDSKENESFEIPTKEGAALEVDVEFSYSYDIERVPEVFTRFRGQDGKEILRSFIKPKMQAWIKEITPKFSMISIVATERGTVNEEITKQLKARFDKYGIIIDNVALADVRPDKDTNKAIKEKIKAQEKLETAKVNAEKDKVKAQKDKDIAEIDAEKARIKAQGEADAALIEAEAKAKANKMISDSLSDKLIEQQKIEKWNGSVPKIQGAGTTIIDTRDMTE